VADFSLDALVVAAYRENRAPVFDAAESRTTSRRLLADDGHTTTEVARILGDSHTAFPTRTATCGPNSNSSPGTSTP
jgi:hypothetical protein